MRYDRRNRTNLDNLSPNTRMAAYKWYQFCLDNNIDILITETIRTKEKQAEYVKNGSSHTLKSWHLVGQALDFVPVSEAGGADYNAYYRADIQRAVSEAKRLGFKWGGDWKGSWDKPHLEYPYKGYGTDKKLECVPIVKNLKGDDDGMTAAEMNELDELKDTVNAQSDRITKLEKLHSSEIPKWAEMAVKSAYEAGLIDTPKGGSEDFYRVLTVLYRGGLLNARGEDKH
ncbi:M15 family metallopeptidase [Paenibacillus zeisoli]|uniref:M15 family metallopeptidase n=1 Tax=Paenibacillus zeisoli TaxID=2496267 RepID=UPI001FE38402|nr:M15 family metallopeptidase [Paenibacillus zeisoli]